jgi:hypothetical protein
VSLVIFKVKPEGETRLETVDFIGRLDPTDSIMSVSTWVEMHAGVDFKPDLLLMGPPTFSGTEVSQMITGGDLGNIYRLVFDAVTASGQTLQMGGFLVVIPDVIAAAPVPLQQYLPTVF